jgi:hypothetical protein
MKLVMSMVMVLLMAASSAEAQICGGRPSFRDGPLQVGIGASFTDGARGVEGTFAGGGESVFAGVGVSVTNFTGVDVRSAGVNAFAGAEFATDRQNKVLLCPVVRVGFGTGPDVGPVDVSTAFVQGGGSIGVIASDRDGMMVVPFFGLSAVYDRVMTDLGGVENSFSDTGGIADLGVGLVFNRTVGITPLISVPFSTGGSDVIFTLKFSFNFGK